MIRKKKVLLSDLAWKGTYDYPDFFGILSSEREKDCTILYQWRQWNLRQYERG